MNDKNLKKLDFHKILKIHDIFFMKSAIFCLFLLYNVQRESLSLSVCKRLLNVETTELNGPTLFVGSNMNPGKVYGW